MKNKTCSQLKNLSKALFWIFLSVGVLLLALYVYLACDKFMNNLTTEGIINIVYGVIYLCGCLLLAFVSNIVLKGFNLLVENSCRLVNEVKVEEKQIIEIKNSIEKINETLVNSSLPKEEVKEDLSQIKKSTKSSTMTPELKELQKEAKAAKAENKPQAKANTPESIKEKLAKAKGEVQKTMAVRSQVAANTISTSMLDDITDKNSIVEFETPEQYSQVEPELFKGCVNLEKVEITENIKLIGASSFSGCDALATVIIGKGVGVIEKNAFEGCTGLDKIVYKGSQKSWNEIVIQSGNDILKRVDITFEE